MKERRNVTGVDIVAVTANPRWTSQELAELCPEEVQQRIVLGEVEVVVPTFERGEEDSVEVLEGV